MNLHARCMCGPSRVRNTSMNVADAIARRDPTGTMRLQAEFARAMDSRWRALKNLVVPAVKTRFGAPSVETVTHAAMTGDDPLRAFQAWFDEALRQTILGSLPMSWTASFIARASSMGTERAAKLTSTTAEPSPRVALLQTMTLVELQGICEVVSQQCTRALAVGLMQRSPPPVIARKIADRIDSIGKVRGRALVAFMTVRAFSAATLDGFRASGISHVGTVAERTGSRGTAPFPRDGLVRDAKKKKKWADPDDLIEVLTAGDDDVCPACEEISESGPYTLDEAEGLIPAHPHCRCAFVPADDARFASVHDYDPDEPRDSHGMWSGLGGAAMKSWKPPQSGAEWASVEGQNHAIHEPPLPKLKPGYSFTDKTTGKQVNIAGQRLSSGVIMREPDGRTWLVKPTNGYGGYKYTFPKGGVEEGLHPQANAIKETFEETGLKARITGYAGDYSGDTSITRMYHAERVGGHPKDKGWETEQVALAHPDDLDHMLNRSRDRKIAKHHIVGDSIDVRDDFNPDEPRDDHGMWTTGGGSIDMADLTKVGGKMGSNEGGTYQGAFDSDKYYVKKPATPDHVTNELLAAKLYQLAGANTLDYVPVKGGEHVATKMEDLVKNNVSQLTNNERTVAQQDFAVHAWLANWDAAGTGGDNIGVRSNGDGSASIVTLDTGGSLKYRAQGEPKGAAFGDKVTEIDTLRDPSKSPDAAKLFGPMTNEQMIASMKRVTSIPVVDINKTIYENGGDAALVSKMIARRDDIAAQMQKMTAGTWQAHAASLTAPVAASPKTILGPNTSTPTPVPVDHPSKVFLGQVKGTSAERVAWRKELASGTVKSLADKKVLQHKIIASFWKQHGKLSGPKQQDMAEKLDQYSKKYGVANPLTAPKIEPVVPMKLGPVFKQPVPSTFHDPASEHYVAPPSTVHTQAELEKAKKNTKLTLQYVPGAPLTADAQKLVDKFNEQYEGKVLTAPEELGAKVTAFKKLQSDMIPLMSEQQKHEAASAIVAKAQQAEAAAKAKVAEALKNKIPEEHEVEGMSEDELAKHMLNVATKGSAENYMKNSAYGKQHDLSSIDVGFIRAYCGSFYSKENEQLRDGLLSEKVYHYKEFLNHALEKLPVYPEKMIYRKITKDDTFMSKYYNDPTQKVVTWQGFSSCAKTKDKWSGNWRFDILHKTGRDVEPISQHGSSEAEVLIPAGVHMKVLNFDAKNRVIQLQELAPFVKKKKVA